MMDNRDPQEVGNRILHMTKAKGCGVLKAADMVLQEMPQDGAQAAPPAPISYTRVSYNGGSS